MKLITAVVKPDVVDDLVLAATEAGARGLTATEVIGFGQQHGHGHSPGSTADLLPKIRLDIVVKDADAETIASAIAKCANTGTDRRREDLGKHRGQCDKGAHRRTRRIGAVTNRGCKARAPSW